MAPPTPTWPLICPAPYQYNALGCSQITVTAAVGLGGGVNAAAQAVAIPASATTAMIVCETANVRWCDDGQVPTATFGNLLAAGQALEYSGPLAAMQFFPVSGTPILDVAFYR